MGQMASFESGVCACRSKPFELSNFRSCPAKIAGDYLAEERPKGLRKSRAANIVTRAKAILNDLHPSRVDLHENAVTVK